MGIRFDSNSCTIALKDHLIVIMKQLQQELLTESKSRMLTSMGKQSLHDEDIVVIANVISASVVGGAFAAMDEWGKGSLMDNSNPALDDYMNSDLWNPSRNDTVIRSRIRGPYRNIFGKMVYSRSNIGGLDLEKKGGKFAPKPPSHAMRTAMNWMRNGQMRSAITSSISTFPFHRYFIITK